MALAYVQNPVAFHGGPSAFVMAEARVSVGDYGPGFYLTTRRDEAEKYASRTFGDGRLYACEVALRKPIYYHQICIPSDVDPSLGLDPFDPDDLTEWHRLSGIGAKLGDALWEIIYFASKRSGGGGTDAAALSAIRRMQRGGYDGIIVYLREKPVAEGRTFLGMQTGVKGLEVVSDPALADRTYYVVFDPSSLVCTQEVVRATPNARRQAAGCLIVCPRTRSILLMRRSPEVTHPGTWNIPGGGADDTDPSLAYTAARETVEEAGLRPNIVGVLDVAEAKHKLFVTYLATMGREEAPTLNWESDSYVWAPFDPSVGYWKLPSPLHTDSRGGFAATIQKPEVVRAVLEACGHFTQNASTLDIEQIVTLPVGAVISSVDGVPMFRRYGPAKTDWERGFQQGLAFTPVLPPERGMRVFVTLTKSLHSRAMIRREDLEVATPNAARAQRERRVARTVTETYEDYAGRMVSEEHQEGAWEYDPAYLTPGHFEDAHVQQAARIASQVRSGIVDDTFVQRLGRGNFGEAFLVNVDGRPMVVKIAAEVDIHGRPWDRAHQRQNLIHEAGVANELRDLGVHVVPEVEYVELADGTPALVREYGEPVTSLRPDEFAEVERALVALESRGWRVEDQIDLYRRADGTLFVADVGIWHPATIYEYGKPTFDDTALSGLLQTLARDTMGTPHSIPTLPSMLLSAKRLRRVVEDEDGDRSSIFVRMAIDHARKEIASRHKLGLPVPAELTDALAELGV